MTHVHGIPATFPTLLHVYTCSINIQVLKMLSFTWMLDTIVPTNAAQVVKRTACISTESNKVVKLVLWSSDKCYIFPSRLDILNCFVCAWGKSFPKGRIPALGADVLGNSWSYDHVSGRWAGPGGLLVFRHCISNQIPVSFSFRQFFAQTQSTWGLLHFPRQGWGVLSNGPLKKH